MEPSWERCWLDPATAEVPPAAEARRGLLVRRTCSTTGRGEAGPGDAVEQPVSSQTMPSLEESRLSECTLEKRSRALRVGQTAGIGGRLGASAWPAQREEWRRVWTVSLTTFLHSWQGAKPSLSRPTPPPSSSMVWVTTCLNQSCRAGLGALALLAVKEQRGQSTWKRPECSLRGCGTSVPTRPAMAAVERAGECSMLRCGGGASSSRVHSPPGPTRPAGVEEGGVCAGEALGEVK